MRSKLAKKRAAKQPTRTDLKTKPWRARGAIAGLRVRMPSKRHVIDSEQVLLVAELLDEVGSYCERHRYDKLVDCPEYRFLEKLCYAAGLVVADMQLLDSRTFDAFKNDPIKVNQADFPDIRRFLHVLWRAERHSDIGEDTDGGHVIEAAESGVLTVLAARLRQIVEGARKS